MERRKTPCRLSPRIAAERRDRLNVFGGDCDSSDRTGMRDYVHVVDLARGCRRAARGRWNGFGCCNWFRNADIQVAKTRRSSGPSNPETKVGRMGGFWGIFVTANFDF
jgi:hypothetical protein